MKAQQIDSEFVVVGSGAAGLRAAAELARSGSVLLLTKTALTESNSQYAQGGIAAAMGESDSSELHLADTLAAGAGISEETAVRVLVEEAPAEIQRLVEWGAAFDREGDRVALAREGAHSQARVLHANGDATGQEIVRALSLRVRNSPSIRVVEFAYVRELVQADGRIAGVRFVSKGTSYEATAGATLLASGGAGQVYRETTNPAVATGDGFAVAYRAGALLRDMEFVQFHPTALRLPGVAPFLISEAIRGEGAWLIDDSGGRFVNELAPRDVVARAIYGRVSAGSNVYLDLRHLDASGIRERFPHIHGFCLERGLDITARPIPVVPAAHYFMGGLLTDLEGRTTLPGLFAAGEVASTGVHGANRLASNSLLECVVFGGRAARAMAAEKALPRNTRLPAPQAVRVPDEAMAASDRSSVQDIAWEGGGIVRSGKRMAAAIRALRQMEERWVTAPWPSIHQMETANLRIVAEVIIQSAEARRESRGAHYRTDYPLRDDVDYQAHSVIRNDMVVSRLPMAVGGPGGERESG